MFAIVICAIVVVLIWFICKKEFAKGAGKKCDSLFQENTKFLLDVGVRVLKRDAEGGFIKVYYSGTDSELQVNLSDTHMLKDIKVFGSAEDYVKARYGISVDETEKFLKMTKMEVEESYGSTDWVCFYHKFGASGSSGARRNWLINYVRQNYPEYSITEHSNAISFIVS